MRWIKLLLLFALSTAVWAQNTDEKYRDNKQTQSATVSTSAQTISVPNDVGGVTASFEEKFTGTPATVSVVISGCAIGGTCDTLETYTTVTNSIRHPTVATIYAYFTVVATWTGGTSPTFTCNSIIKQ